MKPQHRHKARQTQVLAAPQPRQSRVTGISSLTRLVFESYQDTYASSSPKVRARYCKLIEALSCKGIVDGA